MMYHEEGADKKDILLDFNRENDRVYIKNATPLLAMAHQTYDIYAVSGHGVGGSYRPHRSDIGILRSPEVKNKNKSFSLGLEIGAGTGAHLGLNFQYVGVNAFSSSWRGNYILAAYLKHISQTIF